MIVLMDNICGETQMLLLAVVKRRIDELIINTVISALLGLEKLDEEGRQMCLGFL
jgi:hypothetical protein